MEQREINLPERYVKDILYAIDVCLPIMEERIDRIEKEMELKRKPEVSEEVKSFMKVMGSPNIPQLEELKKKSESLLTIHKMLSK
ncbi:hypothetical protein CVD28_01695 [Bacillus sp. M6-12]|uniref:hypothetical protein n=1 Tax=Bacillus sp. M6-12 TaxID=2054166 RepID=UPI000C77CBF0|nr:hypothetical protein [Bacillus sp. M6-12]PLS19147.1 hypothetical protein CVD28_01695 [Bacillus sp. M6-12]